MDAVDTSEDRRLLDEAVSRDFFGRDSLVLPGEHPVPEKYELLRCLGRGGAGTVFLARDRVLDREVALKFLSDVREVDLERFRREARVAARLNDPAIVQIYEFAEFEQQPYIAMQYIDGGNLADRKLDPGALLDALRGVAVALKRAHAQGIVHRDIKPENILLDQEGRGYLADFGIARDRGRGAKLTISMEGQIMGTPALMPPEQARGELHAVDARSDVYAFGATLYYKLTGHAPFEGTNVVDVLHAVIHDEPTFPRCHVPSIPRSLEAIVLKCLRKDKNDRYRDMGELLSELDRHRSGDPVDSESGAWFRRLVGKLVGVPARRSAPEAEVDPDLVVGLELVREIAAWDANLYRVSGSLSRSFAQLDRLVERLDGILSERPDVAWARFYRGVALFRRGRLAAALDDMERSIDRVSDLASAYFELGRLYLTVYLRQHRRARQHVSRSGVDQELAMVRRRLDQAVVAFEEARRLRGDLPQMHVGDYTKAVLHLAESDLESCIATCERILARDPDAEEVWKLRGDAQQLAGADPTDSYDRALQIRKNYHEALCAKAEHHLARGDYDDARACLAKVREIHPELVEALVLEARSHLLEARECGERGNTRSSSGCSRHASKSWVLIGGAFSLKFPS